MVKLTEVKDWLATHNAGYVAVDDGGLTLVILDAHGCETGAYLEVGGLPDPPSQPDPDYERAAARALLGGRDAVEELDAADGIPEHWRGHRYFSGCSHGR